MENNQKFLPALLERLLDDEPKKPQENYDASYLSASEMRAIVQKDISYLLNSINVEEQLDKNRHSHILASVINYGIAPLTGEYAHHHSWQVIEKNIRNALLRFEPRIIPETLLVRPLKEKAPPGRNSQVHFEIGGLIDWQPQPLDLSFKGAYDAETAKVELKSS